jgi:hypothetical protein
VTCHAAVTVELVFGDRKWRYSNNEEMRLKKRGFAQNRIIDKKADLGLLQPFSSVYSVHFLLPIASLIGDKKYVQFSNCYRIDIPS